MSVEIILATGKSRSSARRSEEVGTDLRLLPPLPWHRRSLWPDGIQVQTHEDAFDRTAYRCRLTRTLLTGKPCHLYNKDISGYELCINCKHFLGGGDWGLACGKHYHRLPEALDKACDDIEWI